MSYLTPEQEALILVYQEKWRKIALSTEPIDRQKTVRIIQKFYAVLSQQKPHVLFFDSPLAAYSELLQRGLEDRLLDRLYYKLWQALKISGELIDLPSEIQHKERGLKFPEANDLYNDLTHLNVQMVQQLELQLQVTLKVSPILNSISSQFLRPICMPRNDFFISILDYSHQGRIWQVWKSLAEECGWIFPVKKFCFVCERPYKILLDDKNRLHAEGEPAIQFSDGFSVYARHGISLEYSS
ncbi:hypothetical protein H6F86_29190 [Phormidium sp. FACHB-592]|uniref:DUF6745 domain-containing protein n=1 Tax=Stenomitos frigidus AS-A4 TaxID=2933935 RepID=A0ABV0KDF7_9CYAN|nr:hypothetical protein [Phormidium sp. FACHB-592]MBD2077892.1 hypothetical protein [Phormidium sp. FACHB-592]